MLKPQPLLFSLLVLLLCAGVAAEESPYEQNPLPIGLTPEEMTRLHEIGKAHQSTAPPTGTVRACAEWEPYQGVIIRYPLGIPLSLVAEMSQDITVVTLVSSSSTQTSAMNAYSGAGVNMANLDWVIASTNSYWTRDYGPWFIFEEDGDLGIVDHVYNRPRPLDDVIPQTIGNLWGLSVYGMDLETTGGNHMVDGIGLSVSTELVYNENPGLTHAEVDSIMYAYLHNDYMVLDYIESGGIHHIDCWAKFLDPQTVLVKDVPTGSSSYALLNARADYLSQQTGPWGRPYEVIRVYCPYGTAYTNSLILNDKVFVPTFGSSYDDDALQTYRDAMPGYEVLGFDGSWLDDDAIHCRAMGVPDSNMIYIDHTPLFDVEETRDDILVTAQIHDHSDAGLVMEQTLIYYETGDEIWHTAPLFATPEPDSFYGYIPSQSSGTTVRYYIKATDNTFRVSKHPYIGAPNAHEFNVIGPNVAPQIICPDSLLWRINEPYSFCPEVIDPDDTLHIFTYSDYPGWLTVVDDTLRGTAPDYNVDFTFHVEISDGSAIADDDVPVFVYRCGDVNRDNTTNITDAVEMIAVIFSTPEPYTLTAPFDSNCDDLFNITDVVYLIGYIFSGGPPPCDGC